MAKRRAAVQTKKLSRPKRIKEPLECYTARAGVAGATITVTTPQDIPDRRIRVCRGNDGCLEVSLGNTQITIEGLHIQPNANWAYPHRLRGLGNAFIIMDDMQLAQLIDHYIMLCTEGDFEYGRHQVGYSFIISKKRDT